jgi:hypothetical protein
MKPNRWEFDVEHASRPPSIACLTHVLVVSLALALAIALAVLALGAPEHAARAAGAPLLPAAHAALRAPLAPIAPVAPGLDENDVAPGLEQRLAKWKPVELPWTGEGLSDREKQLVQKLVEACRMVESIYWRQADPEGLALYQGLSKGTVTIGVAPRGAQLRRLLWINGSRWDLLDENRPFVGHQAVPPGRWLYPQGLTRRQIESWVADHPGAKKAIYDEHTVIERSGEVLVAVPYHVAYRRFLEPAARALEAAAALSDDPPFARFLRLRAIALGTDDYYGSDLAWLDLVNPKFDIIFAPYEVFLDDLLGVKTSYGAAVLIRNEAESAKLAVFQKYVPAIQDSLPLAPEDRPSKAGHVAPMEVVDSPFRAGDLRHGYQVVADNLPNDPRVHEKRGSKHIFFKNFLDLRVNEVILPLAQRVMRPDQAAKTTSEGYVATVMMHEIAHGLGPAFASSRPE